MADGVAGACLAVGAGARAEPGRVALALACSLCLFLFGMSQNDLADRNRDRITRPERPLPSGALSLRGARIVVFSTALLAGGLGVLAGPPGCWLVLGMLLLISLYNLSPGHMGPVGPVLLGSIRAANLLLAAVLLAAPWAALAPALGYGLYIGLVSSAARMEDGEVTSSAKRLAWRLRLAQLLAGLAPALVFLGPGRPTLLSLAVAWLVSLLCVSFLETRLRGLLRQETLEASRIAPLIGCYLGGIFLFDASLALAAGVWPAGALLLILFPASRALANRFPAS
ncbi:MAG: UbiA family prenyltransferase [Planctomycetota bacterium]